MIDWFLAQRLATAVAGRADAPAPTADLERLARESEHHVTAYTLLKPQSELPPAEGIGRGEWIDANVGAMRALLDPTLERAGKGLGPLRPAMRIAAGAVLTAEVGVILGFLAQRVLGQYELVMLDPAASSRPPRLLFVLPNLGQAVSAFGAEEEEFLRWVALHEVTHAVQFAGVPWLQPHLSGLIGELLASAELRIDAARALRLPKLDDLKRLVAAVREGDIVSLVASERERALLDRIQATMAVVEGHAEHVMDAIGEAVIPSLPKLRDALERRRRSQGPAARALARLLGLDLKMRQYEVGKRFCDAVVARDGVHALNRVWSDPEALPTLAELDRPDDWLARTSVRAAAS